MNVKKYLFEHPVASVFLAWTGADVVRMGVNLIRDIVQCKHVERVNKQRMEAGYGADTMTYNCETTKNNTEETKEVEAIEEGS